MISGVQAGPRPAPPPHTSSHPRAAEGTLHLEASTSARCGAREAQAARGRRPGAARQQQRRVCAWAVAEEDYATYGAQWSVAEDAYIVLGLAHCFEKGDTGKLQDRFIVEPVAAQSLECMMADAKTCYLEVASLKLSQALSQDWGLLPDSWRGDKGASWCENFAARANATARTWQRPHAQDNLMDIVPLGQTRGRFNYNLDMKRVLNMENVVTDADNVKQDMSIDVYGRAEAEEGDAAGAGAAKKEAGGGDSKKKAEEDDDDLDALLMG